MANADAAWATSETLAKQRIAAIYQNRGAQIPPNLDALARNAVTQGPGYFDTVRAHASNAAPRDVRIPGRGGTIRGVPGHIADIVERGGGTSGPAGSRVPRPGGGGAGGRAGAGGGGGAEPELPAQPTLDFRAIAADMFPWLTPGLLDIFAREWAARGNPQWALDAVRRSPEYDRVFPGIRREDGTLRMTEGEYFGEREGVAEAAAEWGFDPTKYRGMFGKLIEKGIDAAEFYRAAQEATTRFVEPGGRRTKLTDMFMDEFVGAGSAVAALERVRESGEYDKVFTGNRREDGTLRFDEPEFFAYRRGWQRTLAGFGLNPDEFEGRGRFRASVEAEMSINELAGRLEAKQEGILSNIEQVQQFYANNYGLRMTREAILGAAIDPEVERDLLQRRITASQIGGEALSKGFLRNVERAEQLARAGVTQSQARELYSGAGSQLAGLSATTQRFHRGTTSLGQYEDVFALGDPTQQTRLTRALQSEQSSFSSQADVRRDRQGFGLAGLRQR